jgi:hypothetical protein
METNQNRQFCSAKPVLTLHGAGGRLRDTIPADREAAEHPRVAAASLSGLIEQFPRAFPRWPPRAPPRNGSIAEIDGVAARIWRRTGMFATRRT